MQEKGTISIHTENIFPIIKKFLYSDNEIFLRELVANATDATQKIKRLASLGDFKGDLGDLNIKIALDKKAKTLTISDKGIGMTADEIKKYINQIAFSGAQEFAEKFKDAKDANEIIGKFGLGFYSAFMVADRVEIQSLSYQENSKPAHWESNGTTEFTLSDGTRDQRGTDIILHLNSESETFLEENKIRSILDKYCRFLPVPIQFGTKIEHIPDGEDKDGKPKYKEQTVPDIINDTNPIWTKSPSDLKDEDYLKFYQELYPFSEAPLFWIHLNVDYPFNLTGILYFPRVKNELGLQRNKIKLFSRQVFITDEVKDIVPEFLMLLHGVIDSPDIPLNVSRSFLQSDNNVKKINSYITRKVADKLSELFKNDRKNYETKWEDIGLFVKYGMVTDDKFFEKAKEFALLENVKKEYFTLQEYNEKVKTLQTDKDGNVTYLYCSDVAKEYTFLKAAEQKGYDVLLMNSPIDNHFIGLLEQKADKTRLKKVDSDVPDQLIPKENKQESVLSEEQKKSVKEIFEKIINKKEMEVDVEGMNPEALPVTITMDEFIRRMKDMSQHGGGMMGFYGSLPDKYKVTVNGNHPLIKEIISESDETKKTAMVQQAYDLALLSRNMLTGETLIHFINRSVAMMGKNN